MVVGQVPEAADFVVVGGGPGGYTAALRAAQSGRRVMLVDRDGEQGIGGICLREGCIPSKALIETAELAERCRTAERVGLKVAGVEVDLPGFQSWKRGLVTRLTGGVKQLLAAAGVEVVAGTLSLAEPGVGVLSEPGGQVRFLEFRDLVFATGSAPIEIDGLRFDGERVLDSSAALALEALPSAITVVGAGYVGVELGTAFAKLGSTVTLVEATESVLPGAPRPLGVAVHRRMRELGIDVRLGAQVSRAGEGAGDFEISDAAGIRRVADQTLIVAVGRSANAADLGIEVLGVALDESGRIPVGADRRLSEHIAAIGDLTPGPALAHKAMAEAEVAVDALLGRPAGFDPAAVPAVVFSDPEVAWAGLDAAQAREQGLAVTVSRFPGAASGRAATLDRRDGFLEIVAAAEDHAVLGVQVAGPHASELIAEGVVAIEMGATLEDLALTIHPHPTLGEQFAEAAHLGLGRPLHITTGSAGTR